MKVRDLIEEPQRCPQDADVCVGVDDINDRFDIAQVVTVIVGSAQFVRIFETEVVKPWAA